MQVQLLISPGVNQPWPSVSQEVPPWPGGSNRSGESMTTVWYRQPPWSLTWVPAWVISGCRWPSSSVASRMAPCSGLSPACSAPPGVDQVPCSVTSPLVVRCCSKYRRVPWSSVWRTSSPAAP